MSCAKVEIINKKDKNSVHLSAQLSARVVQKNKGVPKYLRYFWKVVFPVALASETSLSEKF